MLPRKQKYESSGGTLRPIETLSSMKEGQIVCLLAVSLVKLPHDATRRALEAYVYTIGKLHTCTE